MTQTFLKKLKMIVMDWDGTLVTAEPMVHEAYLSTFKSLKDERQWTISDTHARNGEDPNRIFSDVSLWGNQGEKARAVFYTHYRRLAATRPDLLQLKEGTEEFLPFLKQSFQDVKLVLLAAKTQSILVEEARKFNLHGYFDAIVGKIEDGPNKPDIKVFDRIANQLGLAITNPRQEVMHIGDNPEKDEAFARSYGAMSVIVNDKCGFKNLHQLRQEIESVKVLSHACFKNISRDSNDSTRFKS